jgi:HAMP domain-containing protein
MMHPPHDVPFLVNKENAAFLAGHGLAVSQRSGDGLVNLIIGAAVGVSSLLLLIAIAVLETDLGGAAVAVIAAASIGALVFAMMMLRLGRRSVRLANAYRSRARRMPAAITQIELADEGGGDWFLKGRYEFADDADTVHRGDFSQYRPDLAGKQLPVSTVPALVLYIDEHTYTIL